METLLKVNAFPFWLKKRVIDNPEYRATKNLLSTLRLNTVCQQALCPNIYDCFSQKRATFLILGESCTRSCMFCAIPISPTRWNKLSHRIGVTHSLAAPDPREPLRIKEAVLKLGLTHVVITSVTRDDLKDGGATHFANCIKTLKRLSGIVIEVLVPDFKAKPESIKIVIDARPDIFSHNIETVPRLYTMVRPQADYQRSLQVLNYAALFGKETWTKSGLMVGLGENPDEVVEVMRDLRDKDCDILTIGQYLRPSKVNIEVSEFVGPAQFIKFSEIAKELGFKKVVSGPFVRSSYLVSN